MAYQILAVLILVLGLVVWSSCTQNKKIFRDSDQQRITLEKVHLMSREDIQRALLNIESSPAPTASEFAMCYEITISPNEFLVYSCPVDGERTTYSAGSSIYFKVKEIPTIRILMKKLQSLGKDLSFSLDERKFCSSCFPHLPDKERLLTLIIKFSDGRIVTTEDVNTADIRFLIGFFTDGLTYNDEGGVKNSLKPVEPRLKELLGEE
jgi:hypothetical protein